MSDCHAGHGANHRLVAEEVHLVARSDLDALPHAVVAGVRHVPVKGHNDTRRVRTAREPVGENHRAAKEGRAHALRESDRTALGEIERLHAGRKEERRAEPLGTLTRVLRNLRHHRQEVGLRHLVGRVTGSRHQRGGVGGTRRSQKSTRVGADEPGNRWGVAGIAAPRSLLNGVGKRQSKFCRDPIGNRNERVRKKLGGDYDGPTNLLRRQRDLVARGIAGSDCHVFVDPRRR